MTAPFDLALDFTLASDIEGGYNDRKADRGGRTNWGFSQRAYPHLDIANLTFEKARQLAYADFWLAGHCDKLPTPLAIAHFDWRFNHGPAADKDLQRALGVTADGKIGPATLAAAATADAATLQRYLLIRTAWYRRFIRKVPSQLENLGWFDRVLKLSFYIQEVAPWKS